ncbi:MAG: serine/threonine-protein kinase [Candidatus Eremiobacterota bacterium]
MELARLSGMWVDGRYRLLESRGMGSFGVVFAAEECLRSRVLSRCCVKLYPPGTAEEEESLREIGLLAATSHPRVIAYRGAGEIQTGPLAGGLFLAMELAERSFRDDIRQGTSRSAVLELVRHAAEGLCCLHGTGIVHRDVKPDNLLRVGDSWKLSDFGLTRTLASLRRMGPIYGGTWAYLAPEVFAGDPITTAVDLWALGVVVQEAVAGSFPFPDEDEVDLLEYVPSHDPVVVEELEQPFGWLVRGCLQREPQVRLSAEDLLDVLNLVDRHCSVPEVWLERSQLACARRDYRRSVALLRKTAVIEPDLEADVARGLEGLLERNLPQTLRPLVLCELGRICLRCGEGGQALDYLRQARDLAPRDWRPLVALGQAFCQLNPGNPELLETLIQVCRQHGQTHLAARAEAELALYARP